MEKCELQLTSMVKQMAAYFKDHISNMAWMDTATKAVALKKVMVTYYLTVACETQSFINRI